MVEDDAQVHARAELLCAEDCCLRRILSKLFMNERVIQRVVVVGKRFFYFTVNPVLETSILPQSK